MAIHSSILGWRILMDRGAWRATVSKVTKSQIRLKRLSMRAHICIYMYMFIFLFLAVLDLQCCAGQAFALVVASRGYSSLQCGFFCCGAQASGLTGFSSCGALAQLLCGMWDPPESRIEPVFPAWASGFFIPEPLGKPRQIALLKTVQITYLFA